MLGFQRVRRFCRTAANRLSRGVVMLLYHRVVDLASDPQWLAVPPALFDQQMEMLRRRHRVMSLSALVNALAQGKLPRRAVVVTFDDGYADFSEHVRPVLERRDVPATLFVTSGFVGRREEFFWDELERLLIASRGGEGELCAGGLCFNLPAGSGERAPAKDKWNVLKKPAPSPRHEAYRALCARAMRMDHERRTALLAEVREWTRAHATSRSTHRVVTEEELAALAKCGVVEIGAHTVTHPRLASLPAEQQQAEITGSKHRLRSIIGREPASFSYPFGSHGDYTPQTIELVREAGFVCACSNFGGTVRRGADVMQLNRVLVRDWDAGELDRRIRGWFDE